LLLVYNPVLFSLRVVPVSLFACLWMQLAEVMSTDKEQRVCPGCREWFEVKSKGTRSDRQYCGDACRKRVHRERQETARRLHAEGRKVKDIARELGADVASVLKWVNTKG
jgi:transposase-like protein